MNNTQKVSLHDTDIDKTNRETYLESLSEKILRLDIATLTKKILQVSLPHELHDTKIPKEQRIVEKTVLYKMLDKGITGRTGCFGEWSNGFGIRNKFYPEDGESESEVAKHMTANKISSDDVEHAFTDVNQYLEGFSFRFWANKDQWQFWFSSEPFNKRITEQAEQLTA